MSSHFLKIDEDGYLQQNNVRVTDPAFGKPILENLFIRDRVYWSQWQSNEVMIEAFDAPLVAQGVSKTSDGLVAHLPYQINIPFRAESLKLDEWDRFHIVTPEKPTLVFSRKAQVQFFDLLEDFDDDSITFAGKTVNVGPYLPDVSDASKGDFWTQKYREWEATSNAPGWDLDHPTNFLHEVLPQLKILRQRVAVMGAGAGHDAAHFASLGHLVTAFDISPLAIERAKQKYPESHNLKYAQMDLLNPKSDYLGQFDLVFEHTFFCAINPPDRPNALQTMHRLLTNDGHLLGNFFVHTSETGPPFGATEWEIRKRFEGKFKPLYWTRWRNSPKGRLGWELITYAQKQTKF